MRDRQWLLSFHRKARKSGLDIPRYNSLKDRLSSLEGDLQRLRDPLSLNLPPQHLRKIVEEQANLEAGKGANPLSQLKNMLGIKK